MPTLRSLAGPAIPCFDGCFAPRDAIFGGFTNLEVWAGFGHTRMLPGNGFGLFFEIHLSLFYKTPFHMRVGSITRESQGDMGSLAMLGGTGVGRVPALEPVGRASRSKDQLSIGASPNLVQPRIQQSGLGEQTAETLGLVVPGTCHGRNRAALQGGGKVELSLKIHRGKGTLKIGVERKRRPQPGCSQPCGGGWLPFQWDEWDPLRAASPSRAFSSWLNAWLLACSLLAARAPATSRAVL